MENITIDVNIADLICPAFDSVFQKIVNCEVNRVILKGGRNSTKSQVASLSIIVGCMTYKASAVCLVKYGNKIDERLVSTFKDSIRYLGVEAYWKERKSPHELVLLTADKKESNVSIKFTGCDDPENLKSYRSRSGGFRYIWLEEATNFTGINEVNNVIQTMSRGEGDHVVVFSYNPDKRAKHWCNKEWKTLPGQRMVEEEKEYILLGKTYKLIECVHHSTYLDVVAAGHADWLGADFISSAEKSKEENPEYYNWAYLGESNSTEAKIFPNVKEWDGVLPESAQIWKKQKHRGFDFGFGGPDPSAFVRWIYDEKNKYLYLDHAFGKPDMSFDEIASTMQACNRRGFVTIADSSNPLAIKTVNKHLNGYGLLKGAKKPPGSIRAGVKWLQSLNGIFINKSKYPDVWDEFDGYEYLLDRDGELTSDLPDANNHYIDATRYAFMPTILHQ